jgi:nucleotide-binding universal stress UspA family protein
MTWQLEHILLTTDFSEESCAAFSTVVDLARRSGARITLLYVAPALDEVATGTPFVSPLPLPTDAEQIDQARNDLDALRDRFAGVPVETAARVGEDVAEAICAEADERGVDLVAVATHGRSGLRRLVLGSVAEAVLRQARVPVLVVPIGGR